MTSFADNTLPAIIIYLPSKWKDTNSLKLLLGFLKDIKAWMASNKTAALIFGSSDTYDAPHMDLVWSLKLKSPGKNKGVTMDSDLCE